MAERSYNGRNIYTSLIDGATGDITRTSSGYIESADYGIYASVIASGVSAEFDSAEVRENRLSLKLSTTNATGRARVGFAASATSGTLVTVADMAYLPRVKPLSTYNFSIWAKTNNVATDGCYVTVASTSGNGTTTFVMLTTTKLTGTNDWTELSGQFTTRQDTVAVRIIFFNDVAGTVSDAWFDIGSMQITEVLPARTTATSRTTASNRVAVRDMGTALRFDGVDDYVEIPDADIPASTFQNGFTLSAWIKPKSSGESGGRIIDKSSSTGFATGFGFFTDGSGQIGINIASGGVRRSALSAYPINEPSCVVVTVNASNQINFYVNGVQSGTANQSSGAISGITTTNDLRIGNRSAATDRTFDGIIDEPRIWNRALTADEIKNLYLYNIVPQDGLVAEYLFDEASGTTAIDSSGNGNDGTISGATYTTDTPLVPRTSI